MNEKELEKLIDACFSEFCYFIGEYDFCPYNKYNVDAKITNVKMNTSEANLN